MSFFLDGPCKDQGYLNTRDHPRGVTHKAFVESLWARFNHLADAHFREDARNHFLQRFWEMYLAVTLLERGFKVQKHGGEGPEYYADSKKGRIWFEAIAPGPGIGPDQVPQLVPGVASRVPTEEILLRFTHALAEKRQRYAAAQRKQIISRDDSYVLAINSRGIRHAPYENTMPYYVQAFLPIGPLVFSIDKRSGELVDSHYQRRPHLLKKSGATVSTMSFLDDSATFCSAALHSGVDCANHPERLGGDFSILFNMRADVPLDERDFAWCEQFAMKNDELARTEAQPVVPSDGSRAERSARA
jgi:hypothetical protein